MTVRSIEIYPTCDIHLLLEGPGAPTTYQLEVRDLARPEDNLSALQDRTKYTGYNVLIADVSPTGLITPKTVGETICRIRHTDGAFVSEIFVRIRIHRRLDTLWFGNNRATLFKGENNYVLSVYGVFDDGTIGDISSHAYLTFDSLDPSTVQVNSTDDRGRLTGREVNGSSPARIAVIYGTLADEIDAFVVPPLSTPRRILERVHGAGPLSERRNILFLAEGFTAAQRSLFRRMVTLIKDEFFSSRVNSPYSDLKDQFNVWMAFDASAEDGVPAGDFMDTTKTGFGVEIAEPVSRIDQAPVVAGNYNLRQLVLRVGLPDRYHPIPTTRLEAETSWEFTVAGTDFSNAKVEDHVLEAWLKLEDYYLLHARDSLHGLMNGARYGDRSSNRVNLAAPSESLMHWYLTERPHLISEDRRRLPRTWLPLTNRNKYIASLRLIGSDDDVTSVWTTGGKDRDLVVFLTNSAFEGVARSQIGIGLSARQNRLYSEVHRFNREADHSVPEIDVLSFPALLGSSLDYLVSALAHELGHVFILDDEYEGESFAGTHDALQATDLVNRRIIEFRPNVVHHFAIAKPPGQHGIIEINQVKWKFWHRIKLCSVLTEDPVVLGDGRLRIRINAGDRAKWDTPRMHNLEVFLRKRNINNQPAPVPVDPATRWLEGPLKILEFQPDGSLILATTSANIFRKGDLLYEPMVHDNRPLTVFHPNVLNDLEFIIEEPYGMKTDASKANEGPSYPPDHALGPDFKPRYAAYVVGVYEGGGTFNTRVYRSSGLCKMRTQHRSIVKEKEVEFDEDTGEFVVGPEREVKRFVPFCYICRYSLVNTLDPVLLEGLPYPE